MTVEEQAKVTLLEKGLTEKLGKIIPKPELKDAFNIFVCGFKLGAIYGASIPKEQRNIKKLIKFLETEKAQQMIYGILLKETDFK